MEDSSPAAGVDRHQAGDRCQRQRERLARVDHQERPDHGRPEGGEDHPREHQPELARVMGEISPEAFEHGENYIKMVNNYEFKLILIYNFRNIREGHDIAE